MLLLICSLLVRFLWSYPQEEAVRFRPNEPFFHTGRCFVFFCCSYGFCLFCNVLLCCLVCRQDKKLCTYCKEVTHITNLKTTRVIGVVWWVVDASAGAAQMNSTEDGGGAESLAQPPSELLSWAIGGLVMFLTFGLGSTLTKEAAWSSLKQPRAPLVGLLSQYVELCVAACRAAFSLSCPIGSLLWWGAGMVSCPSSPSCWPRSSPLLAMRA